MSRLPVPSTRSPARASSQGRPLPVPIRAAPEAVHDNAMRSFVRSCLALGHNAFRPNISPDDHARRMWPHDRTVPTILRAAVAPATSADVPELHFVSLAFLAHLTPMSAGASLLERGLRLQFDSAQSISIPSLSLPTADFTADGEPIPVTTAPVADTRLERFKISIITSATRELLDSGNAEELLKQILIESVGPALDRTLLSASPAAADRPAGLLNGVAPLPPAASLVDNVAAVLAAVAGVAGSSSSVLVCAPRESIAVNLLLSKEPPFSVISSAALPPGTLVGVATNALVSAAEAPQVETSIDALVHEHEQAEPVNIGAGIMAVALRSFYQSDVVGFKLRWPISWALRSEAGVAWVQGI